MSGINPETSRLVDAEELLSITSTSTVIGVMGLTGSGKSTLIATLTGEDVQIGHDLEACTSQVSIYSTEVEGRKIFFLDTPGFMDTYRSDSDVLKDVAFFLSRIYATNIKLAGMIYLHKITDNKMYGSALKNLHMFEKLCGEESMPNIVLATTMWDKLRSDPPAVKEGEDREKKLLAKKDFWGYMVENGSTVFRHDGSKQSAWKMVHHLLKKDSSFALAIQKQMVDDKESLDKTPAGEYLRTEFLEQDKKHEKEVRELTESMEIAARNQKHDTAQKLQELREEVEATRAREREELESLKITMQRMLEEKDNFYEEELRMLQEQRKKQQFEMSTQEQELRNMERKVRDIKGEMDRQAESQKTSIELLRRRQKYQDEDDEQMKKKELELKDFFNHERNLQELKFSEERKIQLQLQKEFEDREMELKRTKSKMAMVQVVGGVGLAAVGAFTSNPLLGAAALRVIGQGMTSS